MANQTLEFAVLSSLVNEAFEAEEDGQNYIFLFWNRFSDSCPVAYGDASYTIVPAKVVLDTVAELSTRTSPTDFFDEFDAEEDENEAAEIRAELFLQRCQNLQRLVLNGPEYFDLEG